MSKQTIDILPFQPKHQNGIDEMMKQISAEFETAIFSPSSKKIVDLHAMAGHTFWVAVKEARVIGTIGMIELSNKDAVLKSMFLDSEFRGQGVSSLLLNTLIQQATGQHIHRIYLGTMPQFIGGQKFYQKNGFTRLISNELPADFVRNSLDTIFYWKQICNKE